MDQEKYEILQKIINDARQSYVPVQPRGKYDYCIDKPEDLMEVDFQRAKSLGFSWQYTGELPNLPWCPKLRKLGITNEYSYAEIRKFDFEDLESASVNIKTEPNEIIRFKSYTLKTLDIKFQENHGNVYLDFSRLPSLRSVLIKKAEAITVLHAENLTKLKSLHILYARKNDYEFLSALPALEELRIEYSEIQDVGEIPFPRTLKRISFQGSHIENISDFDKFKTLEYLDMKRVVCEDSCVESLRGIKIPTAIFTEDDAAIASFKNGLSMDNIVRHLDDQEKNMSKYPERLRQILSHKTYEQRFYDCLKRNIWAQFYGYYPGSHIYKSNTNIIKEAFLKMVKKQYPFYNYEELEKQIEIERMGIRKATEEVPDGSFLYLGEDSIFKVYTVIETGEEYSKIQVSRVSIVDYRMNHTCGDGERVYIYGKELKELLRLHIPEFNLDDKKINVYLFDLYECSQLHKIEFAIVAAIMFAYQNVRLPENAVLAGEFNKGNEISRWEPENRAISILGNTEYDKLLLISSLKKRVDNYNDKPVEQYSNFRDLLENIKY